MVQAKNKVHIYSICRIHNKSRLYILNMYEYKYVYELLDETDQSSQSINQYKFHFILCSIGFNNYSFF